MKIRLSILILVSGGVNLVSAQQSESVSRTINQVYQIDSLGDAEIEVTFQYSASQWATWKEQYGNRPDIVLRDMRYNMATSVLENFSLEKDDVQRRATGKVKARALARYRNSGQFIIDVPKEMKLVTGENRDWIFSFTNSVNGEIVSQTLHAKLPANAHDVHFGSGGDFDNLTYTLDLPDSKSKTPLTAGISLVALGALLGGASLFTRKKPITIVIAPEPSHSPPPQPPALPPVS
ncbi:MAG: hypothetical protein ABI600_20615 [Luteolibacter sp.]